MRVTLTLVPLSLHEALIYCMLQIISIKLRKTIRIKLFWKGNKVSLVLGCFFFVISWLTVARLAPNILSGSTTSRITRCDWPNFHFRALFG